MNEKDIELLVAALNNYYLTMEFGDYGWDDETADSFHQMREKLSKIIGTDVT